MEICHMFCAQHYENFQKPWRILEFRKYQSNDEILLQSFKGKKIKKS